MLIRLELCFDVRLFLSLVTKLYVVYVRVKCLLVAYLRQWRLIFHILSADHRWTLFIPSACIYQIHGLSSGWSFAHSTFEQKIINSTCFMPSKYCNPIRTSPSTVFLQATICHHFNEPFWWFRLLPIPRLDVLEIILCTFTYDIFISIGWTLFVAQSRQCCRYTGRWPSAVSMCPH